jgi:CheY-like chemotaxis protein
VAPTSLPETHDPDRAPRSYRILIADDDPDMVLTLSTLLADEGHVVSHAYTGKTALEAAVRYRPEICLLDINMPGINGYDLASKLRQELGDRLVLIAVTAYDRGADSVMAKLAGFDHHLGKPFDPRVLMNLLHTLVSLRED